MKSFFEHCFPIRKFLSEEVAERHELRGVPDVGLVLRQVAPLLHAGLFQQGDPGHTADEQVHKHGGQHRLKRKTMFRLGLRFK